MRKVVDKNKADTKQVIKLVGPTGIIFGYNIEDYSKIPGTLGFVLDHKKTLGEARKVAGINNSAPIIETKPSKDYPEQQSGYIRPTSRR